MTAPAALDWHVAQLNVARLRAPLDAPETAEFLAALGPVNAIAEAAPGFVWRLTDDAGASSSYVPIPQVDDPLVIVNYSIWSDVESLRSFVYRTDHVGYLRRRREWFEAAEEATTVCWWTPAGSVPPLGEAYERLLHLRRHGPSERGWPLHTPVTPGAAAPGTTRSSR